MTEGTFKTNLKNLGTPKKKHWGSHERCKIPKSSYVAAPGHQKECPQMCKIPKPRYLAGPGHQKLSKGHPEQWYKSVGIVVACCEKYFECMFHF